MNEMQKNQVAALRQKGYGYIKIAHELELSENTVNSHNQDTSFRRKKQLTSSKVLYLQL